MSDNLSDYCGVPYSTQNGIEVQTLDTSAAIAEASAETEIETDARELWESGTAFRHLYQACEKQHVGDRWAIKILLLSYASTRVRNSYGMHVQITGSAGTGKSHLMQTVKKHLPASAVMSGRVSDKALFYHKMAAGTVIINDDQSLSDTLEEIFKESSTDFHNPTQYRTVDKSLTPKILNIPPETVFWMGKVEQQGDEQTQDRQFLLCTDDSPEQLQAINDAIYRAAKKPWEVADDRDEKISRKIWEYVPTVYVTIPYADEIRNDDRPEARNLNLLLDLIRTSALMHAPNRGRSDQINGYENVLANPEDFLLAAKIMNRLLGNRGGSQKQKLSSNGVKILELLRDEYAGHPADVPIPVSELRTKLDLSPTLMTYALNGRNSRRTDGLCSICPAVETTTMNVPNPRGGGTYIGKVILWNYSEYLRWANRSGEYTLPERYIKSAKEDPCQVILDMETDEEKEGARQ